MTQTQHWENLIGTTAVDSNGDKIGKVKQVYLDERAGEPEWVTVSTGMFGTRESFAPLYQSAIRGDELLLAVPKQLVKDAPNVENDGRIDDSEVDTLFRHYAGHLGPAPADEREAGPYGQAEPQAAAPRGRDVSGPTTDDAMTRSEERMRVGTRQEPSRRARLRKYVVTEDVNTTVPVSHEEARLEREPITEENRDAALAGPDISEEEHEVTLHAERPVVDKETVPVERVRLDTETVTEPEEVHGQVRREKIDGPEIDESGER